MTTSSNRRRSTRKLSTREHAIKNGYRSGLEERICDELKQLKVPYQYEPLKIPYTPPVKQRTYTPDIILGNSLIIELKGRFLTADRQKHRFIKEQYPNIDIRFVFQNAKQKINKGSKTSYADWCDRYGFQWSEQSIPYEWTQEAEHKENLRLLKSITKK